MSACSGQICKWGFMKKVLQKHRTYKNTPPLMSSHHTAARRAFGSEQRGDLCLCKLHLLLACFLRHFVHVHLCHCRAPVTQVLGCMLRIFLHHGTVTPQSTYCQDPLVTHQWHRLPFHPILQTCHGTLCIEQLLLSRTER